MKNPALKRMIFIGPRSPPVSGYSVVATALAEYYRERFLLKPVVTTPPFFSRFYPNLGWTLMRQVWMVLQMINLIRMQFGTSSVVFYINQNGGWGQWFDVFATFISRLRNSKTVYHHNSFSYLNRKSALVQWMYVLAGKKAQHVVNSLAMQDALSSVYGVCKSKIFVLSNAAILNERPVYSSKVMTNDKGKFDSISNSNLVVGFMGYIDQNKGIDLFVEVANDPALSTFDLSFLAAGPIRDQKYYDTILGKENISYLGALYAKEAKVFFDKIDILLFPSRYKHEAEPLVVHHALRRGVYIISTYVGCLPDLFGFNSAFGKAVDEKIFVEEAVKFILNISRNNYDRDSSKHNIKNSYGQFLDSELINLDKISSQL